ncbi:MAG: hypothetical protein ACRDTJ_04065, partial [Pseudonocardiaceae bacterium]
SEGSHPPMGWGWVPRSGGEVGRMGAVEAPVLLIAERMLRAMGHAAVVFTVTEVPLMQWAYACTT